MTKAENIEKKIEKINFKSTPAMRDRILSEATQAMEQTINAQAKKPSVRRIIMQSKMTKFAAAAVIIIGVLIGINQFGGSIDGTTTVYAMTDVPELFRQANVVHVKGWHHYNLTDKGQKVPPQPIERWIDLENGRFRFSRTTVHASPEEVKFSRNETISNGQYKMIINHADKSAIFYKMSDLQRTTQTNATLNHLFFGHLFPDASILKEFEKIGEEKIDGIMYDIWECEIQESPQRINRYKYWLSITGTSGRFQSWYKNIPQPLKVVGKSGKEHIISVNNSQSQPTWRLGYDFYKIECNVQIPENVFKIEVPESYEAKNTKENAIHQELGEQNGPYFGNFKVQPRISFTLGDGSVILAWHSGSQSPTFQAELFEDLEFGGALPKLPFEIYGLKPAGWIWTGEVEYFGRHLAYTQKDEKFIEWSLYVPDNPAPNHKQILGYEVLHKFNLEYEPQSTMGLMVDYGIFIETSEDFDKWVLDAMAELSDDGKAPEGITYDGVLELAQQIRESLNE